MDQSERFHEACALIAATYETEVTVPANIVAMRPAPEPEKSRRRRPHLEKSPLSLAHRTRVP